ASQYERLDLNDLITLTGGASGNVGVATTSPYGIVAIDVGSSADAKTPAFVVQDSGTSTPSIYVEGGYGRVGIGTSSPMAQLAIEVATNKQLLPSGVDYVPAFLIGSRGTSTPLFIVTNDIGVNTRGTVGIGTSSPGATLAVGGFGYIKGNWNVEATSTLSSLIATSTLEVRGSGGAGTPDFLVTSGTRIGVATATPYGTFVIDVPAGPDARVPVFAIQDSGTSTPSIYVEGGYGRVGFGTSSPYAQVAIEITEEPGNNANEGIPAFLIQGRGTSTPAFVVKRNIHKEGSSGDFIPSVGIGTSTPSAHFAVEGSPSNGQVMLLSGVSSREVLRVISSDNSYTRLILGSNDTFGIGTTSPGATFAVGGFGYIKGNWNVEATSTIGSILATTTIQIATSSPTSGHQLSVNGKALINGELTINLGTGGDGTRAVCHSGAAGDTGVPILLTDCTGVPAADYAELYPVTPDSEVGDIVAVSQELVFTTQGDQLAKLAKSTKPYQANLIGAVSDSDTDFTLIGHNIKPEDNPKAVALNGRVRIKVNLENGPIKVGDPITSSSQHGLGMKAVRSGRIIGYALNNFDGPTEQNHGTVQVFIHNGFWMNEDLAPAPAVLDATSPTAETIANETLNSSNWLALLFEKIQTWMKDAVLAIKELVVEKLAALKLQVGTAENPIGITIYDLNTRQPNCLIIRNGKLENISGECTFEVSNTNSTNSNTSATNNEPAPTSTEPPPPSPEASAGEAEPAPSSSPSPEPTASTTEPAPTTTEPTQTTTETTAQPPTEPTPEPAPTPSSEPTP
ncbi:MAG: hypothetical protein AAB597_03620, partial [Patescibacteria group bacterium]